MMVIAVCEKWRRRRRCKEEGERMNGPVIKEEREYIKFNIPLFLAPRERSGSNPSLPLPSPVGFEKKRRFLRGKKYCRRNAKEPDK